MVSVQCYMFVCRLLISVQGVIIIDLSSLGCIVPEIKNIYFVLIVVNNSRHSCNTTVQCCVKFVSV